LILKEPVRDSVIISQIFDENYKNLEIDPLWKAFYSPKQNLYWVRFQVIWVEPLDLRESVVQIKEGKTLSLKDVIPSYGEIEL